jgi:MYXO-CTERM domain-containing protein
VGQADRAIRFKLKTGGTTTTLISPADQLTAGQWSHVSATYDGARMRIYLDGTEVASTAANGAVDASAAVPVAVGDQPQGGRAFGGLIDEVFFYTRALSATELAALMDGEGFDPLPDLPPAMEEDPMSDAGTSPGRMSDAGPAADASPASHGDGGCDCTAANARGSAGSALLLLALLGLLGRRKGRAHRL